MTEPEGDAKAKAPDLEQPAVVDLAKLPPGELAMLRVEAAMRAALLDRLPEAVEAVARHRAEWASRAIQLADMLPLGIRSEAVRMTAIALRTCGGLESCERVVCDTWASAAIENTVPSKVRQAIQALVEHAHALIVDGDYNRLVMAERGLREAAAILVEADPLLPIDEAAQRAGLKLNRAGRCDAARRATKWKRNKLPSEKVNGALHAREADCVKWKPIIEASAAKYRHRGREQYVAPGPRNTTQRAPRASPAPRQSGKGGA